MEKPTVNFTGPISDRPLSDDVELVFALQAVLFRHWPERAEWFFMEYPILEYDDSWLPQHLQELIEALNEIAPPGHFFGRHPDHGTYGFWMSSRRNSGTT